MQNSPMPMYRACLGGGGEKRPTLSKQVAPSDISRKRGIQPAPGQWASFMPLKVTHASCLYFIPFCCDECPIETLCVFPSRTDMGDSATGLL